MYKLLCGKEVSLHCAAICTSVGGDRRGREAKKYDMFIVATGLYFAFCESVLLKSNILLDSFFIKGHNNILYIYYLIDFKDHQTLSRIARYFERTT